MKENFNDNLILIENTDFHGVNCSLYHNDLKEIFMTRKQIAEMLCVSDIDVANAHYKNKETFADMYLKITMFGHPRCFYSEQGIFEICKNLRTPNSFKILGVPEPENYKSQERGATSKIGEESLMIRKSGSLEFYNCEFGKIRTVMIDGEYYFLGIDVAEALGYEKARNAISAHVEKEDKTTALIQGAGSNYKSKSVVINEVGLYSLIMRSKLDSAKRFKRWVLSEVLPTIRKTGSYNSSRDSELDSALESIAILEGQIERLNKIISEKKEENKAPSLEKQKKVWQEDIFKRLDTLVDLLDKYKDTNKAISFIKECGVESEIFNLSTGIHVVIKVAESLHPGFVFNRYKSLYVFDFGHQPKYVMDFIWSYDEAKAMFENTLNNIVISIITNQTVSMCKGNHSSFGLSVVA